MKAFLVFTLMSHSKTYFSIDYNREGRGGRVDSNMIHYIERLPLMPKYWKSLGILEFLYNQAMESAVHSLVRPACLVQLTTNLQTGL